MNFRPFLISLAAGIAVCVGALGSAGSAGPAAAKELPSFAPADVFQLEFAADPQILPDGRSVAYLRKSLDIMTDRVRSQLWLGAAVGTDHRPLTDWKVDASSPRWSPDGKRLAYSAKADKVT